MHTQSSKQGDKPEKFTPTLKTTSLQSGCQGSQSCPTAAPQCKARTALRLCSRKGEFPSPLSTRAMGAVGSMPRTHQPWNMSRVSWHLLSLLHTVRCCTEIVFSQVQSWARDTDLSCTFILHLWMSFRKWCVCADQYIWFSEVVRPKWAICCCLCFIKWAAHADDTQVSIRLNKAD